MKTFPLRAAVAALALATAAGVSSPAMAHGYYRGGWHGSSAGWWVGGALALGAAGVVIAANSRPAVIYSAPVYAAPPVVYSAPVYAAPVYAAPPVVYTPPPVAYTPPPAYAPPPAPTGNMIAYPARGQSQAQQTRDRSECNGWAMNQSGYDPVHPNAWTTGVMVDAYNRAISACMTGRGYSVS
ncbi:hypothetical protein ACL598_21405 [Bordetella bronchialis]|uniref:hypothetical protein n=1 Tax=Bordetella bronchialis TaxID=463025 RepID=UPI003CFD25B1